MIQYSLLQIPQQTYRVFLKNFLVFLSCAIIPAILATCVSVLAGSQGYGFSFFLGVVLATIIQIPFLKACYAYMTNAEQKITYKSALLWDKDTLSFFLAFIKLFLLYTCMVFPLAFIILLNKKISEHPLWIFTIIVLSIVYCLFFMTIVVRTSILLPANTDKQPLTIRKALQITKNNRGKILLSALIFLIINFLIFFTIGFVSGIIFGIITQADKQAFLLMFFTQTFFTILTYMANALSAVYTAHIYRYFVKKQ